MDPDSSDSEVLLLEFSTGIIISQAAFLSFALLYYYTKKLAYFAGQKVLQAFSHLAVFFQLKPNQSTSTWAQNIFAERMRVNNNFTFHQSCTLYYIAGFCFPMIKSKRRVHRPSSYVTRAS